MGGKGGMPNYFAYCPEQAELLPRHVRDELPKGHLCFLIHEVVEEQDLRRFNEAYGEEGQKASGGRWRAKIRIRIRGWRWTRNRLSGFGNR